MADGLARAEQDIVAELVAAQGRPQDLGGYYRTDPLRTAAAMRPSPSLNRVIDELLASVTPRAPQPAD